MVYRLRQIVQVLGFAVFLCLLIFLDPITEHGESANFFVRMSPFSAIGAMIAAREIIVNFWPALIVVISTVILGRYFCSWVCPFGTTIDITDKLFANKRNGKKRSGKSSDDSSAAEMTIRFYDARRLKYYVFIFLIIGAVFGVQMTGWFDPLSLTTNTYTILIHPYVVSVINGFFYFFNDLPLIGSVMKPAHNAVKHALFSHSNPFFRSHYIFLFAFMGIVSIGMVYRRYWCRNLCPLGALLALISDWAVFKRLVGDGCISCGKCVKACGMGAIAADGKGTFAGECTLCMTCQKICPKSAIEFKKSRPEKQDIQIDLSKRKLLTAGAFSVAASPILNLNSEKMFKSATPAIIRPPGAEPEDRFIDKCIRCGECMRVCKTNGLQPVVFESSLSKVWTPTLVPRHGYCDYECLLCGKVCPSGAIKRLEKKEKQSLSIGKARFNHNRCIPWVGFSKISKLKEEWEDVNCAVCEEVCPIPIKAIRFDPYVLSKDKEIRRVFIVEELCVGCGFCEKVCPVQGMPAVKVEGLHPQTVNEQLRNLGNAPLKQPIGKYFPEIIGLWKRESRPVLYAGANKLFEYINGGADPYLSYDFIQVAVVNYLIETPIKKKIKVDIWEFNSSENAFGVFAKDRAGEKIDVGDEGSIYNNYLWIWKGNYFIVIEPQEGHSGITAKDASLFGKTVVSAMPKTIGKRPGLVNLLPDSMDKEGVKYFHEKIILDSIYISNKFIENNVLNLGKETDAVIGERKIGDKPLPLKLMIIKYPKNEAAELAFNNMLNLRKTWGEKTVASDPFPTFMDDNNQYYSICALDNFFISTYFAPSLELSIEHVNAARALALKQGD